MPPNPNEHLVRQWLQQVLGGEQAHDPDGVEGADFVDWEGQNLAGRPGMFQVEYTKSFQDLRYHLEGIITWDSFVLCRGYWRGTQFAPFAGTGSAAGAVEGKRIDLFRCEGGRIREHWGTGTDPACAMKWESDPAGAAPSADELMSRLINECLDGRNPNALVTLLTVDAIGSDLSRILSLLIFLCNTPDARIRIQHLLSDSEMASALTLIECRHPDTPARQSEADGERIRIPLILLCRIDGHRIDQIWMNYDSFGLAGRLPAAGPNASSAPR